MNLSDNDFLAQFERQTLPDDEFDHRGHLRLAWLYLKNEPLDAAVKKTTDGIEAYATSLGATNKFHHTLTEAIVRIMHGRLQQANSQTLDEFLIDNPDLVENMTGVLRSYYSEGRLNSEVARLSFNSPDIRSF